MTTNIVITGLGAISPRGLSALQQQVPETDWKFDSLEQAATADSDGYSVRDISDEFSIKDWVKPVGLRRKKRFSQLAMAAAVDAYRNAELAEKPVNQERTGVILGTEYGPQRVVSDYLDGLYGEGLEMASPNLFTQTVYNVANGQASLALKLKGANSTLVGSSALSYAAFLISVGKADVMFASSIDETSEMMDLHFARHSESFRESPLTFTWGEGAGTVVIETAESAESRGAVALAELLSDSLVSAATDGVTYEDWPDSDDTLAYTMRGALEGANATMSDVDLVVGTANGTSGITTSEFASLNELGYDGPIVFPRVAMGECFGGNEALAVLVGLETARPGDLVLINCATVNGGVTTFILRKAA